MSRHSCFLVLGAVLLSALAVSSSFAANTKYERTRPGAEDTSDPTLQNGELSAIWSGVSDGFGILTLSQGAGPGEQLVRAPGDQDNWKGGTNNWSNNNKWDDGKPGPNSDAIIDSGKNDVVTLDVSTTVSSLELSGSNNFNNKTTSKLIDGGKKQTLTISNGLIVDSSGTLNFTGAGSSVVAATLVNNGGVELDNGSGMEIKGNVLSAGRFELNGLTGMATFGGLNNSGLVNITRGSMLTINGDVVNSGGLFTDDFDKGGGNTLIIKGSLTVNTSPIVHVEVHGAGDMWNISRDLINNGAVIGVDGEGSMMTVEGNLMNNNFKGSRILIASGSKLDVKGDAVNYGTLETTTGENGGFNTISVGGTLANYGTFKLAGPADTANIGKNLNNFRGTVEIDGHLSTLNVTGNVQNFANMYTTVSGAGDNIINVMGRLTNQKRGRFVLNGSLDKATVDGLTNRGYIDLENASILTVNGDVNNNAGAYIYTDFEQFGGGSININGTLTNNGNIELKGPSAITVTDDVNNLKGGLVFSGPEERFSVGDTLTNKGGILLGNRDDAATIGKDLKNSGSIDVEVNSKVEIAGNLTNATGAELWTNRLGFGKGASILVKGTLTNAGFVDLELGTTLQVTGNAENQRTLDTSMEKLGGGNTVTISGTLTNTASGNITLNGPMDMLKAMGGLVNDGGTLNANNGSTSVNPMFLNNLGIINIDAKSGLVVGPGQAAGPGYTQFKDGTLGEMISSELTFGQINIQGSALLAGTLNVLLQGQFIPDVGDTFVFLKFTPGQLKGTFGSIGNDLFNGDTEKWAVNYDNKDGFAELIVERNNTVSEPASLLVLVPGLLGMGYGLRRRLLR